MFCFSKLCRNQNYGEISTNSQAVRHSAFWAAVHHEINITFGILVVDDGAFHNASVIHRNLDVEIVRSDVELLHRLKKKINYRTPAL
jgi:hypothetical protein